MDFENTPPEKFFGWLLAVFLLAVAAGFIVNHLRPKGLPYCDSEKDRLGTAVVQALVARGVEPAAAVQKAQQVFKCKL